MFQVPTLALLFAQAVLVPVSIPLPAGPAATARAIAIMTNGIISFTRWPAPPNPMQICLLGETRLAERELEAASPLARNIRLTRLPDAIAAIPVWCDVLYSGTVPAQRLAALLSRGHGRPLLTMSEEDALCRAGAMFCLHVRKSDITFELNLDAVSRSGLTVDPRVLRLSSGLAR